ncbi:DNA mismatch repair protein MutL [Dimargaris cristalligena]|uniref:DNA mismatch repair protein MutL n=1 Tax=Dimargaris cristalligena TaxID=215637 RepID=A0A4P9ZRP6_9FUNG|nr:DNA mismatch repair protein MutL [Dimargaris cristalligena]|eukprot:RKP35431.1 DNA mismatch repair protein MutL [Dimargaris cristalligena]
MDQDNLLKPINSATVHKICSGQVIIDLTTAVKELVENSLDAGATHIEVKFKDYGLESVSVSDNGPGITTGNYATLCLKHYTSKLSAFDDLATVRTYGFRGEALSSLCALAHVTVTTATADLSPRGVQLDYASTGVLKGQTAIAREVGTTITLSQLFAQWPVRYTQFKKTIRREYARCMAVLEAYGAVCAGTRLVVSHQTAKQGTASQMVFQSNGKPLWLDRIAGVFGPKFRSLLTSYSVALDEHASDADGSNRQNQSRPDDQPPSPGSSRIDGYVSLPRSGCGRSGTERQFYYVNGRPCDLPKVARVVNEVYRSYNPQQYPIVFLNIHLDPGAFDVNVSPDKRTLFLHDEARLQNRIRVS